MKTGLDSNSHLEAAIAGDLNRNAANRRGSMFDSTEIDEQLEKFTGTLSSVVDAEDSLPSFEERK
jgi:hypothetical protein